MSYLVEITRLPLPSYHLGEVTARGTELVPPQHFVDEESALQHARNLVQRGFHVQITGDDGWVWGHHEILQRLNSGVMSNIAKARLAGCLIFGVAALTVTEVVAAPYFDQELDAHKAKVPMQISAVTQVSGTFSTTSSSTLLSAPSPFLASSPTSYASFSLDGAMFDPTMDAERRLMPYQPPLYELPRPQNEAGLEIAFLHDPPKKN
jgi:hypothetical protein